MDLSIVPTREVAVHWLIDRPTNHWSLDLMRLAFNGLYYNRITFDEIILRSDIHNTTVTMGVRYRDKPHITVSFSNEKLRQIRKFGTIHANSVSMTDLRIQSGTKPRYSYIDAEREGILILDFEARLRLTEYVPAIDLLEPGWEFAPPTPAWHEEENNTYDRPLEGEEGWTSRPIGSGTGPRPDQRGHGPRPRNQSSRAGAAAQPQGVAPLRDIQPNVDAGSRTRTRNGDPAYKPSTRNCDRDSAYRPSTDYGIPARLYDSYRPDYGSRNHTHDRDSYRPDYGPRNHMRDRDSYRPPSTRDRNSAYRPSRNSTRNHDLASGSKPGSWIDTRGRDSAYRPSVGHRSDTRGRDSAYRPYPDSRSGKRDHESADGPYTTRTHDWAYEPRKQPAKQAD